jgi:ubiquinone/menaquinone biosynthesis C-methylase UbiE
VSTRLDYDAIADVYDDRRRDHLPDPALAAFMAERVLPARLTRVLDVGCGTGKQLAADQDRYGPMTLVGVDRSAGMLRVARRRAPGVTWLNADAAALPLASNVFHYATNQFSYPHVEHKRAFAAEVFRVLRPGGRFVLTNIDPWAMADWALYRYFPEARALDARDFLPPAGLRALLAEAGFTAIAASSVDRSEPQVLDDVLASAAVRHSASQFMAIADGAYEAGLARLRDDVRRSPGARVPSQFVVITVTADKPDGGVR